nr:hypothetical protein [Tanacetum cinerariifolium]
MPDCILTPLTDQSVIIYTQLSSVQGVDTQSHDLPTIQSHFSDINMSFVPQQATANQVIDDVRQLSFDETKLDRKAGFTDVAGSGVDSSGLSHDESFGVDDLDLNLNEPVNLNVSKLKHNLSSMCLRNQMLVELKNPFCQRLALKNPLWQRVEDVVLKNYVSSREDVEQGNGQEDESALIDRQFFYDDEGINTAYETEYDVQSSEDADTDDDDDVDEDFFDLPFDNIGITNLMPEGVLEGEDVDVINADDFDSDPGNDEEKNYMREEAKDRVYLRSINSRKNLKLYKNDGVRIRAICDGKVHVFTTSQGQVLVAVGLDSNNEIYLLAYVLVETESIIPAIKTVYLSAKHKYCLQYIHENIKHEWCGQAYKDLLWRVASATNVRNFEKCILELNTMNLKAHEWLNKIPIEHWARSYFSGRPKSDLLLNNICEVFNGKIVEGRDKPVMTLLEYIRKYCMKRIVNVQGGNNAKASGSASRKAQQTEPTVGRDDSGGSGVGAVISLSSAAGEGGPGGAGVASQGSSHSKRAKRRGLGGHLRDYVRIVAGTDDGGKSKIGIIYIKGLFTFNISINLMVLSRNQGLGGGGYLRDYVRVVGGTDDGDSDGELLIPTQWSDESKNEKGQKGGEKNSNRKDSCLRLTLLSVLMPLI